VRRRMGAAALDMDAASDGSWQTQWRATVTSRLPSQRWPQRKVVITAVGAATGEPVVFDRDSGVDLAAGYERVLVLSPFGGRALQPLHWGTQLATQVDELRARGSRVETIFPDSSFEHTFGPNEMDLSLRPPAARAGYDHGGALAEKLTAFWR